jgi:hypothetical protein
MSKKDILNVLISNGPTFSGGTAATARDVAEDWDDHDFSAGEVDDWCKVGCWDAGTAAILRDAGLTPEAAAEAAQRLADAEEDAREVYTDGCPIYAACNGDISPDKIIEAAKA